MEQPSGKAGGGALPIKRKGLFKMKNTIFDALTDSRATLGKFLRSLPVLEAPWDAEFQERFCAECDAANCDECRNEEFRNNPEWWLTLEAQEATQ